MNNELRVILGDIVKVKADALIVSINPGGGWDSCVEVNASIFRAAGDLFHGQVSDTKECRHGDTVVAF